MDPTTWGVEPSYPYTKTPRDQAEGHLSDRSTERISYAVFDANLRQGISAMLHRWVLNQPMPLEHDEEPERLGNTTPTAHNQTKNVVLDFLIWII